MMQPSLGAWCPIQCKPWRGRCGWPGCSGSFTCSCLREKNPYLLWIFQIWIPTAIQNVHARRIDEAYCERLGQRHFPFMLKRGIARWLLESLRSSLFLHSVTILPLCITRGTVPSSQHWSRRSCRCLRRDLSISAPSLDGRRWNFVFSCFVLGSLRVWLMEYQVLPWRAGECYMLWLVCWLWSLWRMIPSVVMSFCASAPRSL